MAETTPSMEPVDLDRFADGPATTTLPLTEPQREMVAAVEMSVEASCAYNQCFVLRLRGPFSAASMDRAFAQVAARHEALRLRIAGDGERQEILDSVDIGVPFTDLAELPPSER